MVTSLECQTSTFEGVVMVSRRVFEGISGGLLVSEVSLPSLTVYESFWSSGAAGERSLSLLLFFLPFFPGPCFSGFFLGAGKSLGLFSQFFSEQWSALPSLSQFRLVVR